MFFGIKKALKQHHLYNEIVFSNPKLLSVESKICLSCRFSLCPIENFCLTDSRPVALQKFSRRHLFLKYNKRDIAFIILVKCTLCITPI